MDWNELTEKYRALQVENDLLKDRIKYLEKQVGIDSDNPNCDTEAFTEKQSAPCSQDQPYTEIITKPFNKYASPTEKIDLFLSFFRGRNDVFAKRWENQKKGTSGYSPGLQIRISSKICHY
jgi:hypothetical protein